MGRFGHAREDTRATFDVITDLHEDFGFTREPEVDTRTEANQADAFAASDGVTGFLPGHDATSNPAGDLFVDDFAVIGELGEDVLLILERGRFVPGGEELAGFVIEASDGTGDRSTVYVDIPDCEEDADTAARIAIVVFILDDDNTAVRGCDDKAGFGGNVAVRVAKETEDEQAEQEEDHTESEKPLDDVDVAQTEEQRANHEWRQAKGVAFADHSFPCWLTAGSQHRPHRSKEPATTHSTPGPCSNILR